MAKIRWNDQRYGQLVAETRQSMMDNDTLDSAPYRAHELLINTPGLGNYIRNKRGSLNATETLIADLTNGIGFEKWYT